MKGLEISIKEFRVKLQKYYSTQFSKLKIFNTDEQLDIEEYYQKLLIEKGEKRYTEDKLFSEINKKGVKCLFQGDIGSGKSTLVKYLCYQWAKDSSKLNSYRLVIYLRLRNLGLESRSISDLVRVQYRGLINNFNVNEFLFEYQDDILFVFDGLDEIQELEYRDNFYKINQFIENSIITSRTDSININRLYLNNILYIGGFLDIEILNNIYSERDLENSKNEKIIKYVKKLFNVEIEESKLELLGAMFYLRNDKHLVKLLKNPLFLILIKNEIEKYKDRDNAYKFYSSIIENLVLEYNRNINVDNLNHYLKKYNKKNRHERLKEFIIDKLSFLAYNSKNSTLPLNEIESDEVNYILSLGFIKTNEYRTVKENAKYRFIGEIIQKYFLSQYIAKQQNLTDFKKDINSIRKNKKIDSFAFLNILLNHDSKEYQILVNAFTELIDDTQNEEEEIKLLTRTEIEIIDLKNRIEHYDKFINSLDSRIEQRILRSKLMRLKRVINYG